MFFSFFVVKLDKTVAHNWKYYINPLNQLFYFLSGCMIARYIKPDLIKNSFSVFLIILSVLGFVLLPISNEYMFSSVHGFTRLTLSFFIIILIVGIYTYKLEVKKWMTPLIILGEISYGVYLLHPLVYKFLARITRADSYLFIMMYIALTLLFSYLSYVYFEKKLVDKFRR